MVNQTVYVNGKPKNPDSFSGTLHNKTVVVNLNNEKPNNPDPFSGTLHYVDGTLISHIPPPFLDSISIDGKSIRIKILKSGDLQLTSLASTDNKRESIKNTRLAHRNEIAKHQDELKQISAEKLQAEEQYINTLDASGESDDALAKEILQLVAKQQHMTQKLAKLEDTKELEVEFTTQSGISVSMQPGSVTVVPFCNTPMVWCPKSLAKVIPIDDKVDVITVNVRDKVLLETPSEILDEDTKLELFEMLPINNDANMVLHKLHDQTQGTDSISYTRAVNKRGNIIVVIESNAGQIFGGFYVEPISFTNGSQWYTGHKDDFLFSLGKKDQISRFCTKLIKPQATHTNAINSCQSGGLCMGSAPDLRAFQRSPCANIPRAYTLPAEGYPSLPTGESIAGVPGYFTLVKMEVYELKAVTQE